MKREIISELYKGFEAAAIEVDGVECWSAGALCPLLGYSQWRNFAVVIEKAKEACRNAGNSDADHFPDVGKMVGIEPGLKIQSESFGDRSFC